MGVIKVLIVDDSALVRQSFRAMLETDPDIQVIGTASDPYVAVQKIQKEKPDVITLDIEMPRMDGLTFLRKIMSQAPMPVLVISNQTARGAEVALKALEIGAVDVMSKPGLSNAVEIEESRIRLIDHVRSAHNATTSARKNKTAAANVINGRDQKIQSLPFHANALVAIGASTGGTEAIKSFLQELPAQMPPILIVQHMPEKFTASFANRLNDFCTLRVKEAEDNEPVVPGTVYVARGDHHMVVRNQHGKLQTKLYKSELVNRHRPSVNVLFNSVAEVKGKHAIGIIMTGMGDDGATGLKAMFDKGAYTIAQDESTSVVFGMPHKAILAGGVSSVMPLSDIAKDVCERIQMREEIC